MWFWISFKRFWQSLKPKPQELTFSDFIAWMNSIARLGPPSRILKSIPRMDGINIDDCAVEDAQRQTVAIYGSMSAEERRTPEILNGSRRKRIADGAGVRTIEVAQAVQQIRMMRDTMRRIHRRS
jgi:signal recognition particle subunit SRP54